VERYRMRPREVGAMQFDGTAAGVERVVRWMQQEAPGHPVRPRTEYRGWEDLTGYTELEVRGIEHGAMPGDWIVLTEVDDEVAVWFIDDRTFTKYFEAFAD
jgi:hypothetical protein